MRRILTLSLAMCVASPALADWQATLDAARGQTVYWNAWGGDERTNSFISWAGQETERLYGVKIEQVKLTDTAEAVTRVIAEVAPNGQLRGVSFEPPLAPAVTQCARSATAGLKFSQSLRGVRAERSVAFGN